MSTRSRSYNEKKQARPLEPTEQPTNIQTTNSSFVLDVLCGCAFVGGGGLIIAAIVTALVTAAPLIVPIVLAATGLALFTGSAGFFAYTSGRDDAMRQDVKSPSFY